MPIRYVTIHTMAREERYEMITNQPLSPLLRLRAALPLYRQPLLPPLASVRAIIYEVRAMRDNEAREIICAEAAL